MAEIFLADALYSEGIRGRANLEEGVMGRSMILAAILLLVGEVAGAGSCLEGDCQDGGGTFQWNDGSKFSGSFVGGDPSGEGIYTDPDGKEYHVTYQEGRPVVTRAITPEEKKLTADRKEAEKYNEAGLTFLRKKDLVSAIFYFNKAITLWPDNPEFHKNYRVAKGLKK